MDSLQEILGKRDFTPPDEMAAIREYISRRYKANSYVKIQRARQCPGRYPAAGAKPDD
jgi:hypothetical protein